MDCSYCGAANAEEDSRCARCGWRLGAAPPGPSRTSALPAPAPQLPPVVPISKRDRDAQRLPHQQSLFRLIPFESLTPRKKREAKAPSPAAPEAGTPESVKRVTRHLHDSKQRGLFPASAPPAAPEPQGPVPTSVRCKARVAALRARAAAAGVDASIVLSGFLLFLITYRSLLFLPIFRIGPGALLLSRWGALTLAAAYALLFIFYKLLFALRADRSPGLKLLRLRILHFDGRPPTKQQRLLRVTAGLLSFLPAGIGFWWAPMDEERLSFHDHVSQTFVTPDMTSR